MVLSSFLQSYPREGERERVSRAEPAVSQSRCLAFYLRNDPAAGQAVTAVSAIVAPMPARAARASVTIPGSAGRYGEGKHSCGDELPTGRPDRRAVVLPEVGNGLEVRRQALR